MPGPVYRDSISQCEMPSMLYDTIRSPHAGYIPPKPFGATPAVKDTMETTQQRLNREMLERFQNSSSRMSHHSFVVVVQSGKYLFLAIMLPVYLCFYGIPRWLLTTAIPQIFYFAKNESIRIGQFFQKISRRILDIMKGALEQMIGDALKIINQTAKNILYQFIASGRAIYMACSKTLNKLFSLPEEVFKAFGSYVRTMYEKIIKAFNAKLENLKGKIDLVCLTAKRGVFRVFNALHQTIMMPLNNYIFSLYTPLTSLSCSVLQHTLNFFPARYRFRNIMHSIFSRLKRVIKWVEKQKGSLKLYFDQVLLNIYDKYRPIHEIFYTIQKEIAFRVKKTADSLRRIKVFVFSKVKSGVRWFQSASRFFLKIVRRIWLEVQKSFKQNVIGKGKAFKRWKNMFRRMKNAFGKILYFVSKKTNSLLLYIENRRKWLSDLLRKGWLWLRYQLIIFPSKVIAAGIVLARWLIMVLKKGVAGGRFLIALFWAIASYSCMLFHELLHEIKERLFSQPQKPAS